MSGAPAQRRHAGGRTEGIETFGGHSLRRCCPPASRVSLPAQCDRHTAVPPCVPWRLLAVRYLRRKPEVVAWPSNMESAAPSLLSTPRAPSSVQNCLEPQLPPLPGWISRDCHGFKWGVCPHHPAPPPLTARVGSKPPKRSIFSFRPLRRKVLAISQKKCPKCFCLSRFGR